MDNKKLVADLVDASRLKTPNIIKAFLKVDRTHFILEENRAYAYSDHPLTIGYGQTISQPTTVAIMLEYLMPKEGDGILDIGAGSGWTTALLASIVGASGTVAGLELIPDLVQFGQNNLKKSGISLNNVAISQAGSELGLPGQFFDKILVSASAKYFPNELLDQLKIGGRIVVPVDMGLHIVTKASQHSYEKDIDSGYVFVPLIH